MPAFTRRSFAGAKSAQTTSEIYAELTKLLLSKKSRDRGCVNNGDIVYAKLTFVFRKAVLALALASICASCAAQSGTRKSALSDKIEEVMDLYRDVGGVTDVTDIVCPLVTDAHLSVSVKELDQFKSNLVVVDARGPTVPVGALSGSFRRSVDLIRMQIMNIYSKENEIFCWSFVQVYSGF